MTDFGDYFREIYAYGLMGKEPAIPVSVAELEEAAAEAMDDRAAAYVFAGAGGEDTMRANLEAFRRWRIVPRMMRDVAERDLSRTVLGTAMPAPVMLAPIGIHKIVHEEGEPATARAAARVGLPLVASTASHATLEEIAAASGDGAALVPALLARRRRDRGQLRETRRGGRLQRDRAHRRHLHLRLEAARPAAGLAALPGGDRQRQLLPGPGLPLPAGEDAEEDPGAATGHFVGVYVNPSLTWDKLAQLREMTSLPIVVKGILHPDDAREAVERGADGIVVSNHGGRQIDGALASLDALPGVVDAVGDRAAILLDSGIRGGGDSFKALALGADAVLVGRPYLWGLALGGEQGVETVLRMLLAELDLTWR